MNSCIINEHTYTLNPVHTGILLMIVNVWGSFYFHLIYIKTFIGINVTSICKRHNGNELDEYFCSVMGGLESDNYLVCNEGDTQAR